MKETFVIPKPLKGDLDEVNSKTGLSKSEVIRQALYKHLKTFEEVEG